MDFISMFRHTRSHKEYVWKYTNMPTSPTQIHTFTYKMNSTSTNWHIRTEHIVPSVFSFPCVCPRWPAASSPSTGWRSMRGQCRTSMHPSCHPCIEIWRDSGWKNNRVKRFKISGLNGTKKVGGDLDWGQDGKKMEQDETKAQIQQNVNTNLFNS